MSSHADYDFANASLRVTLSIYNIFQTSFLVWLFWSLFSAIAFSERFAYASPGGISLLSIRILWNRVWCNSSEYLYHQSSSICWLVLARHFAARPEGYSIVSVKDQFTAALSNHIRVASQIILRIVVVCMCLIFSFPAQSGGGLPHCRSNSSTSRTERRYFLRRHPPCKEVVLAQPSFWGAAVGAQSFYYSVARGSKRERVRVPECASKDLACAN